MIVFWNVNGIMNLCDFLNTGVKFNMLFLCETWLTNPYTNIYLPNFDYIFSEAIKDKARGRAKGGLLLLYNKNLYRNVQVVDISPFWKQFLSS